MGKERLRKIGKIAGEAVLIVLSLLWLIWYFAPRELIEKRFSLDLSPGPGKEIFRILTGGERFPKFTLAVIEPKDVKPGEIQKLTVQVEDPAGVVAVTAVTELDNGVFKLPLRLVDGDEFSGYWTNAWTVRDTHARIYRTKFTAVNKNGNTRDITLAWSDPCTPPLNGDWTIDSSCSISGVTGADNGNINFIGNYTMTINTGATVAFNPGRQINLSTGVIALSGTAQIRQTNLWITDADGDNYAPSNYSTLAQDSQPGGYSRRYSIAGTNDCYDANANARPNQTSYFTTHRGDGSFDYNCSGAIEYQYGVTSDLCGCNDSWMTPGYTTNPGCGVSGTYYTGCVYASICGTKWVDLPYYSTAGSARTQACR